MKNVVKIFLIVGVLVICVMCVSIPHAVFRTQHEIRFGKKALCVKYMCVLYSRLLKAPFSQLVDFNLRTICRPFYGGT